MEKWLEENDLYTKPKKNKKISNRSKA